ncbi:MAG: 50S ribosomal protein L31 [Alphaproteobacteria bacterium]|nr:50S ribosomal protein L31 [Alphaproteobacteria bacterium]
MKPNVHPDYHEITIKTTDGKTRKSRSTWGKAGDVMQLEVDPASHPAWTGNAGSLRKTGQVEKFANKFGNIGVKK